MGFLDLDLPCDIRDIIADVRNLAKADDIKLDMIAMLALDLIGVIPVIGALKILGRNRNTVQKCR